LYAAVVVPGFNEQVMVTTRPDRNDTFDFANALPPPVNQSVEGTPHISLDGRSLYFFTQRGGSGSSARDLYVATRSDPNGTFETASPLASVNSSVLDHLPWPSADELTLYFASERSGNQDIWRATRTSRADGFGAPAPVTELNSSADDNGMTLTGDDRTIIIASKRPNGAGDYDLYQAVRASTAEPFSTPQPLPGINTSGMETDPSLAPDGQELFFVSARSGETAIWRSLRSCP
jgi:Tol biopolymer transport system component